MAKQEKNKALSLEDLAKMYGVEIPKEEPIQKYEVETAAPKTEFLGREKELEELAVFLKSPEKRIFGLFGAPMIGKSELTKQFLRTQEEVRKYQILRVKFIANDFENPDTTLTNALKDWDKTKPTLFVFENFEQTLVWRISKDLHQIHTDYQIIKEFLIEVHHSKDHKILLESRFQCNLIERNVDFETLKNVELKGVDPKHFWADYEKNGVTKEEFEQICKLLDNHTWLLRLCAERQTLRFYFQNQPKNIILHPTRITEKLWEVLQNEILNKLEQGEDAVLCALVLKSPIDDQEFADQIAPKLKAFQYVDMDRVLLSLLNKFLIVEGYEINPFLQQVCRSFLQKVRHLTFKDIEKLPFFRDAKRSKDTIREAHRTGNYKVFFEWVRENRKAGKYDLVIEMLQNVYWESSKPVAILNEIGVTYKYAKKYDKAKEVLEKACELGNIHSFNELAIIYRSEGNLKGAKEILEKALEINPQDVKTLNELAIIYRNEGNWSKAKEILEKALEIEPENVKVLNELAIIYKNEGNTQKVKEIYQKALEIEPNHQMFLNELAIIYKNEGNLTKAKEILEKACELGNIHSFNELAIIYKNEGNLKEAKEILEKACELGNIHSFNELAIIYKNEGNLTKAKEILEKAIALNHIPAMNELAIIYKNEGNLTKAKEILEKALKTEPSNVKVLNELAIIYRESHDFENALKTVEKGLAKEPNNQYLKGTKASILQAQKIAIQPSAGSSTTAEAQPSGTVEDLPDSLEKISSVAKYPDSLKPENLKTMHPIIKKALSCVQEANYAGYFEAMESVVPPSLQPPYQEHKGKFIGGQYAWNFYQQLDTFAREVDRALAQNPQGFENLAGLSAAEPPKTDLKALYELLNTKFNDESLNLFCMLHFEAVHTNFTQGQTKIAKITALLDYAKRQDLLGKLANDLAGFQQ